MMDSSIQNNKNFYLRVYELVKKIPKGRVSTYGTIAALLKSPRSARAVGYALNALKKDNLQEIPWQRVVNSKGEISFKGDSLRANLQRKYLELEGIHFSETGKIDLKKFGWNLK